MLHFPWNTLPKNEFAIKLYNHLPNYNVTGGVTEFSIGFVE
jgi:hypothetical protein